MKFQDQSLKTFHPQFTESYFSPFIHHFNFAVDTFFVLSGFLVTISFLKQLEKRGRVNILKMYLHRYLRITPVVAVTIFLFLTLFRFVGSGPYHNFLIQSHLPQCQDYWWSALLHVQNYVNPNNVVSFFLTNLNLNWWKVSFSSVSYTLGIYQSIYSCSGWVHCCCSRCFITGKSSPGR